jgi:phosphate starvation-inducible protein PhoH and related proteins
VSTPSPTQLKVLVPGNDLMVNLLGHRDELLKLVEESFPVTIHVRGNEITVTGDADDAERVGRLFEELVVLLERGHALDADGLGRSIEMLKADQRPTEVLGLEVLRGRKPVRPKTSGQKRYVDAVNEHTVTFAIGPAGTGKSYLAVALAVQALQAKTINRIILTRPAVEAGERLGFLPGDVLAKVDPYLRPLYDALYDMLDTEVVSRLMDRGTIEVAPLAFMRGRAQPVSTPVLTPTGFRPIGALQVGDLVVGASGRPTPVLGVYPQGRKQIFEVRAQDGAATLCCGEHLWHVITAEDRRRGKPGRVLETQQMAGRLRAFHRHRYELPLVANPVEFVPQPVPMDPYALGLLLGDGCLTTSTTPSFATHDEELARALDHDLDSIEVRLTSPGNHVLSDVRGHRGRPIVTNPVTAVVRKPELAGATSSTKFVPDAYLHNAPDVRIALLQGLLDSDGRPVAQGSRSCRINYTTCSPRLRDDVLFLVRSLGGVACWRCRRAAGRRPGCVNGRPVYHRSDAYILDIRLPAGIEPFRLRRKRDVYRRHESGRPMRFIDAIEPAGEADTVCIEVLAADSLYVTEDFLVTHNTLNDSFIILDEAQNTTPEQMKMFLTRLGFGSKVVVTGDVTQIDLPEGKGRSGLRVVRRILDGIDGVAFVELGAPDVVRHRIVQDIVNAYERASE